MSSERIDFPVTLVLKKGGDLVWLGHLDLARGVQRALRRSNLPLVFTEGFHPRPKLRLPEPLPVGVGSDAERYVVQLAREVAPEEVAAALGRQFPRGIELVAVWSGAHPEALGIPIDLAVASDAPERLAEAVRAPGDAAPGPFESTPAVGELRVRLASPTGGRASVGRFLIWLKARAAAGGVTVRGVQRRVALQSEEHPLQSRARFPGPGSPGDVPGVQPADPG